MTRLLLTALLVLAAAPAGANWGPSFGGQGFQSKQEGADRILGWEAGLVAFGPAGQGFWHFAYGRAEDKDKALKLTSMAARLSFRLIGGKAAYLYAGGGFARDELKDTLASRKAWLTSLHAGILVNPARLIEFCWSSYPCFPCFSGSNDQDCVKCLQNRNNDRAGSPEIGPGSSKSLNLAIEGGMRFAGPTAFNGYDARAFLLVVF